MNVRTQPLKTQTLFQRKTFEQMKVNAELIAAVGSGVLILLGWLLGKNGLTTASVVLYLLAFLIGGFAKAKEGIEETVKQKKLNVEMLMIFAAVGSAIIGYWAEGAILIFIFSLSGALETFTMNKSHREISSLMEIQPEEAWRIVDDQKERVHVSQLQVGDLILIRPGERVPSDGEIIKGMTTLDEATITGESVPVAKGKNEEVFAGTVNLNGSITVRVNKPNDETLFQKIIQLVQSAQSEKSPSQLFIERFEGTYVKIVLVVVLVMMFLPHFLLGWSWTETFYRAMILLVVASPCALVASIMPATLSAISNGARHGILFKGGVHLEQLSHIKAVAFDKTGTLTTGKPEVTDVIVKEPFSEEEILPIVAAIEKHSSHPLAHSIVSYVEKHFTTTINNIDTIEDIPGFGVKAIVQDKEWKIGNERLVDNRDDHFDSTVVKKLASEGKTVVYVQRKEEIVGVIALKDTVRPQSKKAIDELRKLHIYTIMLTGDNAETAKAISKESEVDDYIAQCLPQNKVDHVKELKNKYGNVAMVGDGINDAPALATANVGISVGDGTDVALETSDMILMKNDLSRISEAIRLSQRMNTIIKQNIIFSIAVIVLLIISNFFQVVDLPLGVIGHEGSTILVILNSLRLLK